VPSSLTFHLHQLMHAGLSRQLIYSAEYGTINALVAYLTENCCGRDVVCDPVAACTGAASKTSAA